jgi:hypothetical protein
MVIASNCSSCVTCLNKSSSAFILTLQFGVRVSVSSSRLPTADGYFHSSASLIANSQIAVKINIDRQRTNFLDQHIEGFRHTGVDLVIALDDILVNLGTAHSRHRTSPSASPATRTKRRKPRVPTLPFHRNAGPRTALYPPNGCWVTSEYGPVERACILSSTRWWSFKTCI